MERRTVGCIIALALATAMACGSPDGGAGARTSPTGPDALGASTPAMGTSAATASASAGSNPAGIGIMAAPADGALGVGTQVINFPPRNEPNEFFIALNGLYRDRLSRTQTTSFVDPEGANVWLTEYFRYRLNGCSHAVAASNTLSVILNGVTPPTCGSETTVFPPRNEPNDFYNTLTQVYQNQLRRSPVPTYVDGEGANVWLAEYLRFRVGGCDNSTAQSKVFSEILNGGVESVCATGQPTTPPTQPPTGTAQLRASFTVTGPSGNNRCLATSNQEADCTFDASASTGGPAGLSYSWEYRTNQSSDRSEFGVRIRPLLGCGFSSGVQTFPVTVTLVITDRANNNNRATATATIQGIRVPGNCGFNP